MRRRELRLALRTKDRAVAHRLILRLGVEFDSLCGRMADMILLKAPDQDIREAIQAFGRDLLENAAPPPSFAGPNIDRDYDLATFYAKEEVMVLSRAIADNDFSGEGFDYPEPIERTRALALRLAQSNGMDVGALPAPRATMLHNGIALAQLEQARMYLERLKDPFAAYAPQDPLFGVVRASPSLPTAKSGPTFGAATKSYIQSKSGLAWTARTEDENVRIFGLAEEHFGAATPLQAITIDHVRDFRDGLITWRKKPPADAKLADLIGAAPATRIGAKTAAKYFQYVTAAFSHWVAEGYLDKSPVGRLSVAVPKSAKATARHPFTRDELKALFTSPIFTGCAGPLRRTVAGCQQIRDGWYWLLLIAPLSGMRITEIVQLATDDVDFDDSIPAFRIRADAERGQSVKSDAGWRSVPIHRRLLELGFKEFVIARQAHAANGTRLLHDVHVSETGGAGGEASKLFGRTLKRLDLKRSGLVFHSFRHAFIDQLREHGAPEYIIKQIVGHARVSVTDGYGAGATLRARQHWLDKVDLLNALPPERAAP